MMDPSHKLYIQSIARAFSLIEAIANAGSAGAPLTVLAAGTGLPPSTAYRILQNLTAWNYITEREDGSYALGPELARLGKLAVGSTHLVPLARPYLMDLSAQTRQTIYLARLADDFSAIYYAEKIPSPGPVQMTSDVGHRNPLHSTANGKVLLSALSDDRIREILQKCGMPPVTARTITDIDQYLGQVQSVRQKGFAVDDEENENGVMCIAAPVLSSTGDTTASVSVSFIASLCDKRDIQSWIPLLLRTTDTITALLCGRKEHS